MDMTTTDELMTVADAAAYLKLSKATIRRWIDRGELPAYRVGPRRVRLKRSDVEGVATPRRRDEPDAIVVEGQVIRTKMTPEEAAHAAAWLERVTERAKKIRQEHGVFQPDGTEIIRRERLRRTWHLDEVGGRRW